MPIPSKKQMEPPKTAKERVFLEVREWIIDGTLEPGEKLSDQELSHYFSVSRTPVREALQLLADQKLVVIRAGKETRVAPLDRKEALYNYRTMAELQVLAVAFAFPRLTDEVIDELAQLDACFSRAEQAHKVKDAAYYDKCLHMKLLSLCGSRFLPEFSEILFSHIQRFEHLYYAHNDAEFFVSHAELIEALRARDLEAAKTAMRDNWLHTLNQLRLDKPAKKPIIK